MTPQLQTPTSNAKKLATKAVKKIEDDLLDRRGFKHLMHEIKADSPETYKEILGIWRAEISKVIEADRKTRPLVWPTDDDALKHFGKHNSVPSEDDPISIIRWLSFREGIKCAFEFVESRGK